MVIRVGNVHEVVNRLNSLTLAQYRLKIVPVYLSYSILHIPGVWGGGGGGGGYNVTCFGLCTKRGQK